GRAGGGAERAAHALLQPVLVPPEAVASAEARIDRPLVLRVLLRDRLLEDLLEGDPEALEAFQRLRAHETNSLMSTQGKGCGGTGRFPHGRQRRGFVGETWFPPRERGGIAERRGLIRRTPRRTRP